MKRVYLDSLNVQPHHLKSVLKIIYHLIVLNRRKDVDAFKLSFDKVLERQFCEITDEKMMANIQQQIEHLVEKIVHTKADHFSVSFKVMAADNVDQKIFLSFLSKQKVLVMEEYNLPINIAKQSSSDVAILNTKLQENMKVILQNIQNDETAMNLTQDLHFELVAK